MKMTLGKFIVACIMFQVAAGEDQPWEADSCWNEQKDQYMPCNADSDNTISGNLNEMKQRCYELDDACAGITCDSTLESAVCTLRHHEKCTDADGAFLAPSPQGEVTYVKQCAIGNYQWSPITHMQRACANPSKAGSLLQYEIRCAQLGPEYCAGVQCKYDTTTKQSTDCYSIEYEYCGAVLHTASQAPGNVFWEMTALDKMPALVQCTWTTHDNSVFTCNQPTDDAESYTFEQAKKECLNRKSGQDFCNGVWCKDPNPLKQNNCKIHNHCVVHKGTAFTEGQGLVHLTRCTEGPFCVSDCWDVKEMDGHACNSDCDCTGRRVCSEYGYCADADDVGRDVPPATITPPPASGKKGSHAFVLVLLVLVLIGLVAGLAYRNRQLAQQFVAPAHFHTVPTNDDDGNWIIDENEDKEEH